jgi:hypothetical protein
MNIDILSELQKLASSGGFQIVDDLGGYVSALVGLLLIIASIATFAYLVWGGIRYLTAGPDKGKVEEARSTITNAIIGLGIVAASWAVFLVLNYFFGLGITSETTATSPSGGTRTSPPAGYCLCGNGQCAVEGSRGPIDAGKACYTCNKDGTWSKITPEVTCQVLNCTPCP